MKLFGSKDIKKYVKDYILRNRTFLTGKSVVDIPAGNGYSTQLLKDVDANVSAYDLFPEFFKVDGLECIYADLDGVLPIKDNSTDVILFQEGIEHLKDQLNVLREMNRILVPGGCLLLTTPNYSNLRAKFSYLLNESEIYKLMPPNTVESIWFGDDAETNGKYYFGHVFLIGIHKLRLLASLAGFEIKSIQHTRVNITSLFLMVIFYPLIVFSSYRAYKRALRKNTFVEYATRKKIFGKVFKLMINPKILIDSHLFVEFEKKYELNDLGDNQNVYHKHSGTSFDT